MIKFEDIIKTPNPEKTKIKFNMKGGHSGQPAYDALLEDGEKWIDFNAHRRKGTSNDLDKAEYLVAMAQYKKYGAEYYLFGGVYKVKKIMPEVNGGRGYELTLLKNGLEFRKRLVIKLSQPIGRDLYCQKFIKAMAKYKPDIYTILPESSLGGLTGYKNVRLTQPQLQEIINNKAKEWKDALSNVKGVYVITDVGTGNLYIGSAYGKNGIWQRWKGYANTKNLTNGNKDFKKLKKLNKDYIINNFRYSILEIFDFKTNDEEIIEREHFWIDVLDTRKHGMNNN